MNSIIHFSMKQRRKVTLCNHNYSEEGILHPDRIMNEYDFLYMQNGQWDIIEDDTTYHLETGSLLILEPGKHHYSTEKCSPHMRNIYIHVENHPKDFSVHNPADGSSNTTLLNDITASGDSEAANYLPVFKLTNLSNNHEAIHTMERIIGSYWAKNDTLKDLRCSVYLEELLLRLSDEYRIMQGHSDVLISEIIHRFDCETHRFLSPEELANDYQMSIRSLSGRFKKWTGMSIHQYQLKLKLEMAYDIIPISKGRSLHDIALSFGFYDEFQFSKLFKREFGISPSERR